MALFITFEGGEGSGKSTQAELLYRFLLGKDIPALLTHEPGGTPLGEEITRLLKWASDLKISPLAEVFLFNASRAELVGTVIRPALAAGKVFISDRFTDSTVAYQSFGRGLPLEKVRQLNDAATGGLTPDLTVLVDLDIKEGFKRKAGERKDRFESETVAFHERVRRGFLALAASEPGRFLVVDGSKSREEISAMIRERVFKLVRK